MFVRVCLGSLPPLSALPVSKPGSPVTSSAPTLDVWSRRVVGCAIGEQMLAELVLAAMNMALEQRKPEGGVIHHSDQGSTRASSSANAARRWACAP